MTLPPFPDGSSLETCHFWRPISLTLLGELVRCQVAEQAVGSVCIAIDAPDLDLGPGVVDRQELRDVQAFVAQPAVERHYVPVLSGSSRADEVELHAAPVCPFLVNSRRELGAVIHGDRHRPSNN